MGIVEESLNWQRSIIGEKVVCIDDESSALTIGKVYIVEEVSFNNDRYLYTITNDITAKNKYWITRFNLLSDIREEKLKKILSK